jgi:GAF domain
MARWRTLCGPRVPAGAHAIQRATGGTVEGGADNVKPATTTRSIEAMTNATAEESTDDSGAGPAIGRRELEAAHEIARAFLATTQPIEVYRLALSRLAPMVRADFAAVFLRDDSEPEKLRPVCLYGWPQSSAKYLGLLRIRVGRGPTGRAVAENRAVEITDVFADPALSDWREAARELGFSSLITIPLATPRGVSGAASFYFREPRVFTDEERRLLGLISEQLAATTLRARLVEELRSDNEQLRGQVENLLGTTHATTERSRGQDQLIAAVMQDLRATLEMAERIHRQATVKQGGEGASLLMESALRTIGMVSDLLDLRLGRARLVAAPEDAVRLARLAVESAGAPPAGSEFDIEPAEAIVPVTTDGMRAVRALTTLLSHAWSRMTRGRIRLIVEQVERTDGVVVEWTVNTRGIGVESGAMHDSSATLEMTLAAELAGALGGSIAGWADAAEGHSIRLTLPSRRI